jgi:hypothetical protein
MIVAKSTPLVMYEVTDTEELAKAETQRAQFRKNSDWLEARVPQIYAQHRGKCICVAGQELFVADTATEVVAMAKKAHPEDKGFLLRYIPLVKMERIYAYQRVLASVR